MYDRKVQISGHVKAETEYIKIIFLGGSIAYTSREETQPMVQSNYKCLYWYVFKLPL